MSQRNRILGGAAGLAASRLAQLAGPLIQLPLLIRLWGMEVYGGWVSATALATTCLIASLSIYPAVQAHSAMNIGRGDNALAGTIHRTGMLLCLAATGGLLALLAAVYAYLSLNNLYAIADIDLKTVLMLFLANALSGLAAYNSGVMGSIGRFGLGETIDAARRTGELVITLVMILFFNPSPFAIACAMLITATAGLVSSKFLLEHYSRGLLPKGRFSWKQASTLKEAILGAFCLAYAYPQLFVLGPRLLIGAFLGNAAVVEYTVASSLIRIPRQVADVLSYPFLNDMSYAYGQGNLDEVKRLFLLPSRLCLWMSVCAGIGIVVTGPFLINLMTGETIRSSYTLLPIMVFSSLIECTSLAALTFLLGIGRTALSSMILLVFGAIAVLLAVPACAAIGLTAFAIANVAGTLIYGVALWAIALHYMKLRGVDFVRAMMQSPISDFTYEINAIRAKLRGRASKG